MLLCVRPAIGQTAPAKGPNIVFILADDLGYGDVQCLNPERGRIRTPQLDRLAGQGMIFTDAHSGSSVCTPTRYGLLTGRYAWRTRLQNGVLNGFSPPLIDRERLTVGSLLQSQGYYTACIGKWHLGMNLPVKRQGMTDDSEGTNADLNLPIANGPISRGFDSFFGISASLDMPPFAFIEQDRFTEKPTVRKTWVRPGIAAPGFEAVDVLPTLGRRAMDLIERRAREAKPFFLYLALASPHTPIVPSKPWQGRSGLSPYADFVMETDEVVGQMLGALDRTHLASNTLVFFASDNGCSPAAKVEDLERAGHFPSAQFRGYKADIWEGGHRVPFLARWPGRVKAGSRSDATICLTDFMATVAEILGVRLPDNAGEDSFSFEPVLLGTGRGARESVVNHSIQGKFAFRSGPWKLEFCPGSGGWGEPRDAAAAKQGLPGVQLYNLSDDVGEQANLGGAHPEIVSRMTEQLEQLVQRGRSTLGRPQTNDVPVDVRKPMGGSGTSPAKREALGAGRRR